MPTHSETRHLPYTAQQMYDLVADVGRYPEFLPWCAAARIRSRRPEGAAEVMEADLVISFKVFRERFGSRVVLYPDEKKIDTEYLDGPFRDMKSNWAFADLPEGG
ncbi:type II toxin-antitoxin system RatA family toxin, partial [Cribrihabitans sp. XS_ASV171]